jgi:hypothetical protein
MTSFNVSANNSFNQLIVENQRDPQWVRSIQSLLNYKAQIAQNEQRKNTVNKKEVLQNLVQNYKLHTINGVQYISVKHLTNVLLKGKLTKAEMYNDCMVALPKLVNWICAQDTTKIKKGYLKKYD